MALERIPVRDHTELQDGNGNRIGEVTSGLLGPTIDKPVAMGYVDAAFSALGTKVVAIVRGKPVPMEVRHALCATLFPGLNSAGRAAMHAATVYVGCLD
jgi:glycine cleavage system aminomethyltransferase T